MSRENALLLAADVLENRAAHALARHYPGGMPAFLSAMNIKAQALGMRDAFRGSDRADQQQCVDGARPGQDGHRGASLPVDPRVFDDVGSDGRYRQAGTCLPQHQSAGQSAAWDVGLSKTGYINEAGKCLVIQARLGGRRWSSCCSIRWVSRRASVTPTASSAGSRAQGHRASLKGRPHAVVASAATPAS